MRFLLITWILFFSKVSVASMLDDSEVRGQKFFRQRIELAFNDPQTIPSSISCSFSNEKADYSSLIFKKSNITTQSKTIQVSMELPMVLAKCNITILCCSDISDLTTKNNYTYKTIEGVSLDQQVLVTQLSGVQCTFCTENPTYFLSSEEDSDDDNILPAITEQLQKRFLF